MSNRRPSVTISPIPIIPLSSPTLQPSFATSPPAFGSARSFDAAKSFDNLAISSSARSRTSTSNGPLPQQGKALNPFPLHSSIMKILLLENISQGAKKMLSDVGFEVEEVKGALGEDEVIAKLNSGKFQAVGIRSKTRITARVIREVPTVSFFFKIESCRTSRLFERNMIRSLT
jgi:D-3-phosphoglycerate dehydrogenase